MDPYPARRNSGKAIAALVLGICGLAVCPFVCSVPAIVLGHMARQETHANPTLDGRGLATAGWVMGIVGVVFYGLVFAVYVIVLVAVGASSSA